MRKSLFALLLLAGVAASANLALAASAPIDGDVYGAKLKAIRTHDVQTRASKLRTSGTADTIWIGYAPGNVNTAGNYWGVGKGANRPPAVGGYWDFDHPVAGDTLQGWWPLHSYYPFATAGADRNRPARSLDSGNQANYVLPGNRNAAGKRTFGVVGIWHRDPGHVAPGSSNPVNFQDSILWTPIGTLNGTSASAWCGLRRHGDQNVQDAVTNNYFNEDVSKFHRINAVTPGGNDKRFPGYDSQWDQMLYRDINVAGIGANNLTLSYKYRSILGTNASTSANGRSGWFDKDPLVATQGITLPANAAGNYIEATPTATAPRDSFMVYVGAGVAYSDTATFVTFVGTSSSQSVRSVYDINRRWFSEVLRAHQGLYKEYLSRSGNSGATQTASHTVLNADVATWSAAFGGKVRVVFRVKTNRLQDDGDVGSNVTFNSQTVGAAIVDDVTYDIGAGAVTIGDFESATAINNDPNVNPLNAWKSTGKPTQPSFHAHALSGLTYEDVCRRGNDLGPFCNMEGNVISAGFHDLAERGGSTTAGTGEYTNWMNFASPVIQLGGPYPNPVGFANASEATALEDYYIAFDIYNSLWDFTHGATIGFVGMTYPGNALGGNGYPAWGQIQYPGQVFAYPPPTVCGQTGIPDFGLVINNLLHSSNLSGLPDSLIVFISSNQDCAQWPADGGCSTALGGYLDNISVALVNSEPIQLSAQIYEWLQDSFPANEVVSVSNPAAFDTAQALVKGGLNGAPRTASPQVRYDVPNDSVIVTGGQTGVGAATRVDMVFRVLPGPGNYVSRGNPQTGPFPNLRAVPTSATAIPAPSASSSNFWSSYMADNGAYGTGGNGTTGPGHPSNKWDPNIWNSARCDTAEINIFATQGRSILGGPGDDATWMSCYHELDPKFTASPGLGITKNRCFVLSPDSSTSLVDCVNVPAYISAGAPANGYNGVQTTKEYTKIIPDGQLTAGAHVEYFFSRRDGGVFKGSAPDTTNVTPQTAIGPNTDGIRWQQFSVLPDRWKDPAYTHPVLNTVGAGKGCMLVCDYADRNGNEKVWQGVADSIGLTAPEKYGAQTGWHAAGGQDVNDASARVAAHLGQPGTFFDYYNIKAAESYQDAAGGLGTRNATKDDAGNPQISLRRSKQGPTPAMMDQFYKLLVLLSGPLAQNILPPFDFRTSNDIQLIETWLDNGASSPSPVNRAIYAIGDGFAEAMTANGGVQQTLLSSYFGAILVDPSYDALSGNNEAVPDLTLPAGGIITINTDPARGDTVGVRQLCLYTNDVLDVAGTQAGGFAHRSSFYEERNATQYGAGIAKPRDAGNTFKFSSLLDGFDIEHLTSRGVQPSGDDDYDSRGRLRYEFGVFSKAFANICGALGSPTIVLDVPNSNDARVFDFAQLRNNPMMGVNGAAKIHFGLAKADQVDIRVFDVSGRLVKTLASGQYYRPGEYDIRWDGLDNNGKQVARGVYFTRVKYRNSNFLNVDKLTVLK